MRDWNAWAANHAHPVAARAVLLLLEKNDADEEVWQFAENLVELVVGVPMKYGRCEGGPWHARDLAHPEPSYVVPFEAHSKKVHVGVLPGTAGFTFGTYNFEESTKKWLWTPPNEAPKRVDNKTR